MNKGMLGFPGPYTRTGGTGIYLATSGTDAKLPWPDGAEFVDAWIQAAGGEGAANANTSGSDGGSSSITYNGVTTSATGGKGGQQSAGNNLATQGGNGGGGDFSVAGESTSGATPGGKTFFGVGGTYLGLGGTTTPTKGGGGYGLGMAGAGGEMVFKRLFRERGQNYITYTVGAGGTGGGGQDGAAGCILFQWIPPLHTA